MIKEQLLELVLRNAVNYDGVYEGNGDGLVLIDDLAYDSVCVVNLIVDIEDTFGVSLEDIDMLIEKIDNFDSLIELLEECLEGTYRN